MNIVGKTWSLSSGYIGYENSWGVILNWAGRTQDPQTGMLVYKHHLAFGFYLRRVQLRWPCFKFRMH